MTDRARVILYQDDQVALIERHRAGLHYFIFPGGAIEDGETPEQAAIREAWEELGVRIAIERLAATSDLGGNMQYFFLANVLEGDFGTGSGEDMTDPPVEKGSSTALWIPFATLNGINLKPASMAETVVHCRKAGWPNTPIIIPD